MKKTSILQTILLAFIFVGCNTIKHSQTSDADLQYITKSGIIQNPLVTDLIVEKDKKQIEKSFENQTIEQAKENAIGAFIQQNNCDLIVAPFFETATQSNTTQTITVVRLRGYPASFKNIRNYTPKDSLAFTITSFSNNYQLPILTPQVANDNKPDGAKLDTSSLVTIQNKSKKRSQIYFNFGLVSGDYASVYTGGEGLGFNQKFGSNPSRGVTLDVSSIWFPVPIDRKNTWFYDMIFITAKVGYKYIISPSVPFYLEPQIGYNFAIGEGDGGISYSLKAGYQVSKGFSLGIKYDVSSLSLGNFKYYGFGFGVHF